MKVAIVGDSIYTFVSGAAVFTERLADQLSERIDEVIVITAGRKKGVKKIGNKKIYFFPALHHDLWKNFPVVFFRLDEIRKILKKEKVDVVHLQLPTLLCIATNYFAKKLNIPVVVTSHTQPDNILDGFNINSKFSKDTFYKYITFLYNFTDFIVFPSEHAKKEAFNNGFNKKIPSRVISNGIDNNKFIPRGKKKKQIIFVGRLMREKSIDTLIRASKIVSKSYPEYEFIIAGKGHLMESLKKLAKSQNPKISFLSYIPDKKLIKLYQDSEIFVLPSECELQGIVLLEAMSSGMVTIASDSKKSAAGELANFTFKHRDYKDLSRKIINIIKNKELKEDLMKKNRINILREHNYDKIMKEYIDVYRKVIKSSKNKKLNNKRLIKKVSFPDIYKFLSSKYAGNQSPIWIDLRITSRCNLRCVYCDIPNNPINEMSLSQVKRVLDKIPGYSWILLTGGEPLLRKDIGEIIDYTVFKTTSKIILNTNLLLLKDRYEEVKNCDGFYFSLDGTKETHEKNKGRGTWEKVIDSLELLHREKRGKISMTVVTSNTTMEDIKNVLHLSRKYDIIPAFQLVRHYSTSGNSKSFSPKKEKIEKIFDYLIKMRKKGFLMMNSVKGLEVQKKLLYEPLDIKCYSGKLFCTIDSDGMVGLCFSRPRHKKFANIKNPGVSFKDALKKLKGVKPHTKRCYGCSCMAPIEFSLFSLINLDVVHHNNQSFSHFSKLENKYIKNKSKCKTS